MARSWFQPKVPLQNGRFDVTRKPNGVVFKSSVFNAEYCDGLEAGLMIPDCGDYDWNPGYCNDYESGLSECWDTQNHRYVNYIGNPRIPRYSEMGQFRVYLPQYYWDVQNHESFPNTTGNLEPILSGEAGSTIGHGRGNVQVGSFSHNGYPLAPQSVKPGAPSSFDDCDAGNFYDAVREIYATPDNREFEDVSLDSSSTDFVPSPKPTQSLPSQTLCTDIGYVIVDSLSPPPVDASTSFTLLKSQSMSDTPDPPISNIEMQSCKVQVVQSLVCNTSNLTAFQIGSQDEFALDSPLTPNSDSPTSPALLCSMQIYMPTTYPLGPHYCHVLTFEPNDFTIEVLGLHVGDQAQIQVWPNGWKTILPELRNKTIPGNILEADAKAVKWMANSANAAPPGRSIVHYLDYKSYDDRATLIKDIRSLMAKSFVVVLPNAVDPVGPRRVSTLEDITYELGGGSSPAQAITYHDMGLHVREPGNPYVHVTLPMFLEKMKNPEHVCMLLNLPLAIETIPHPFHLLNDAKISAEQIASDTSFPARSKLSYLSNHMASKWGLLHMADTAGYAVGGQVAGDRNDPQPKFWAVLSFKDPSKAKLPPKELAKHFQAVSGVIASSLEEEEKWEKALLKAKKNKNNLPLYLVQDLDKWSEVWNVEVIYLRPGDIFFQPPSILHLVYTPAPAVTFGSHSYGYDTMHLTETACCIQHLAYNDITNQVHIGTYETLEQMVLALWGHTERVFYTRAIAALCIMILFPARYFNGETADETEEQMDKASEMYTSVTRQMAIFVINHYLDISKGRKKGQKKQITEEMLVDYLYGKNTDYMDPGLSFTLGNTLTDETRNIFVRMEKLKTQGSRIKK
ncbi:hypothetical protein BDP27DRAFT_1363268 [Rhodocollybia butyracea]|uniref:JmjC domain-containing protein n=1 Tax=Rhodocollybia butyracea TaxID=206335 RepID=A0A9P5PUV4_9AGAR|nr:hypothetical protein BDP27DRAFT_1363268 [Rhodocollybia butyracea]